MCHCVNFLTMWQLACLLKITDILLNEERKNLFYMLTVFLPLDSHYSALLVQCTTVERCDSYLKCLQSLQLTLFSFYDLLNYSNQDGLVDSNLFKAVKSQLNDIACFIVEVKEKRKKLLKINSMKMSLETWLRDKLDEKEKKHDYEVATDTVRAWIDLYNEKQSQKQL